MQMESSQRKGVLLLALVKVFQKESEFQAQIRLLMKNAPRQGIDVVADDWEFAD